MMNSNKMLKDMEKDKRRREQKVTRKAVNDRIKRETEEIAKKLAEAKSIIIELDQHEGAEGWSEGMRERIDNFIMTTLV